MTYIIFSTLKSKRKIKVWRVELNYLIHWQSQASNVGTVLESLGNWQGSLGFHFFKKCIHAIIILIEVNASNITSLISDFWFFIKFPNFCFSSFQLYIIYKIKSLIKIFNACMYYTLITFTLLLLSHTSVLLFNFQSIIPLYSCLYVYM